MLEEREGEGQRNTSPVVVVMSLGEVQACPRSDHLEHRHARRCGYLGGMLFLIKHLGLVVDGRVEKQLDMPDSAILSSWKRQNVSECQDESGSRGTL